MTITFQELIKRLDDFWKQQGCLLQHPYDVETGAATFNPSTFARCLGPEPYNTAYVEPCRRPTDGRYGQNPNRVQCFHQYQVVLKPSPDDIQDLYVKSLEHIGIDLSKHDIRFVHDDWESPTLGAWGLGWEVWLDGMEVTQFTYFQACGGVELKPVTGELAYGLERLAMYIQNVDSMFDIKWNDFVSYGDLFHRNEVEWSQYNFEKADVAMWLRHFDDQEREAKELIAQGLPIPALDFVLKASHSFNLLDARSAISVTERTGYIQRIRSLACDIAEAIVASRKEQGFPLMGRWPAIEHTVAPLPPQPQLQTEQADFLLELGSEELPAAFVPGGVAELKQTIAKLLEEQGLPYSSIESYATPRRLALLVKDLAVVQPKKTEERRGPAVQSAFDAQGQPTKPAEGFFKSLSIQPPTLKQIQEGAIEGVEIRELKGKEYVFAVQSGGGGKTGELLTQLLPAAILNLHFPKKMRWGDEEISYARPLHWIVALFDGEVLPLQVGNIVAGRLTQGHRQLNRDQITLKTASEYVDVLRQHQVMVDVEERTNWITDQLDGILTELNATAPAREQVMREVVHLSEWPQLTVADYDQRFLAVPKPVLISEMVEHQRYFPVEGQDGKLLPKFVITADNTPCDTIRAGNQKVLSARLSDGAFLYETDLKTPLDTMNKRLEIMTFQKELGSVWKKVERLQQHARIVAESIGADVQKAERAATLCKADLASQMVYEFPDLQGAMGREYALHAGEDAEVAQAIEEHWMPQGERDSLPESMTGVVLSIADKLDNLIACFGLGLKPTSSSDPYACRRQLLGLARILIDRKITLPLKELMERCFEAFPQDWQANRDTVIEEILEFAVNRIKTVFQGYGFGKDEIEASLSQGLPDVYTGFCKVQALHGFRQQDERFPKLLEVYKRASGQVNGQDAYRVNEGLLSEAPERSLYSAVEEIRDPFAGAVNQHDYDAAYGLVATLQVPLAEFFDGVKVLAEDEGVRHNRLALLQEVMGLFDQLLDFGKIQER